MKCIHGMPAGRGVTNMVGDLDEACFWRCQPVSVNGSEIAVGSCRDVAEGWKKAEGRRDGGKKRDERKRGGGTQGSGCACCICRSKR